MPVHTTAVIDPSSTVDPSAAIGPYAVVGPRCVIGPECFIGPHATVERTRMGRGNRIFPGAHVGGAPQDLKFAGEETLLAMGDFNTARECVTLNRGTRATGKTTIGSHCLFMAYSHVAHDCVIGNNVIFANSVALAGHVSIGDFTVLGGLAAVHQYARIGRLCMLGGGTMLPKDVPPFCLAQGDRATLRGLNLVGLRRSGFPPPLIRKIKEAYKALFMSGRGLREALAELEASSPPPEVREMVSFIKGSVRGVIRPSSKTSILEEEAVS